MNFSLKSIAVAVTLAVAAAGANAAIEPGNNGNGELFFNVWDANGSYTRDLNISIDAFESLLAAGGNLNQTFEGDAKLLSFLSTAQVSSLQWNVVAADSDGDNRLLTTFTAPYATPTIRNTTGRNSTGQIVDFAAQVNEVNSGNAESVIVTSNSSPAWAGKDAFSNNLNAGLNFSNAGTLDNNSFASGLGFMRMDILGTGSLRSVYNVYGESATSTVNVWIDSNKALHIAAVPEPSEYAMLLAGLGMIGFMARRNKRA